MLGDITPAAVADPDERWKLAYLLPRACVRADERAEQFQGTLRLLLAEPADEQLQPLPRCHGTSLTVSAVTWRAPQSPGWWMLWKRLHASTTAGVHGHLAMK